MKFENLMLHGLFLACFAVSALILAAMLTATPPRRHAAARWRAVPAPARLRAARLAQACAGTR